MPVVLIAGALLGWMAILAAGAYWAPVGQDGGNDFRKLWVVAGTTGGFLLLWGLVLVTHRSKLRRQAAQAANSDDQAAKSASK